MTSLSRYEIILDKQSAHEVEGFKTKNIHRIPFGPPPKLLFPRIALVYFYFKHTLLKIYLH